MKVDKELAIDLKESPSGKWIVSQDDLHKFRKSGLEELKEELRKYKPNRKIDLYKSIIEEDFVEGANGYWGRL